ncbi:MAG: hypothetical protein ABR968_10355 [Bacteroidales bacterium]|jgi:ppGpp synthetase/RelA/SpoT-type nucleotidyltranferase
MEKYIEKYQSIRPIYEDFNERIKGLITSIIDENHINYHLIESRTKTLEGFKEKILRKELKYTNPIEEMTDIVGARIILYYQDELDKVIEIIKKEFLIDEDNSIDKGKLLKANEFGYQSVHYVCKLSEKRNSLPEWKKYSNLSVEIQIRTVLQHSWASISHELEYKKNFEIPSVLQRKLFRLAGLFELADEQFINVRDEHHELINKISQGHFKNSAETVEILEELNLLTLKEYFNKSELIKQITENAKKAGFGVGIDTWKENYSSEIIHHCNTLKVKTISGFNQILSEAKEYSYKLFLALFRESKSPWTGSPVFFVLLIIIFKNINNIKDIDDLSKDGWSTDIASRVIDVSRKFKID